MMGIPLGVGIGVGRIMPGGASGAGGAGSPVGLLLLITKAS